MFKRKNKFEWKIFFNFLFKIILQKKKLPDTKNNNNKRNSSLFDIITESRK